MDDTKIVELLWQRSEQSFGEMESRYGALCRQVVFAILGEKEDTEECVNDAYYKVWMSIPPHRPENFTAYLCKVARNLAFDRYKYHRRQKRCGIEVELAVAELAGELPLNHSVEESMDRAAVTAALNRFLAMLDGQSRVIFLRRYWFFDSIKEISKRTKRNENTVKTILFRERNKLAEFLREEGVAL